MYKLGFSLYIIIWIGTVIGRINSLTYGTPKIIPSFFGAFPPTTTSYVFQFKLIQFFHNKLLYKMK